MGLTTIRFINSEFTLPNEGRKDLLKSELTKLTNIDFVGVSAHLANLGHVTDLLVDQCAFETHQHEQREQGIVPVLVQAPHAHAEYLDSSIGTWLMGGGQWVVGCMI